MADLLRSGNTMLNKACPVCNNPIFRNREGNTFCPTCNRKVILVKDDVDKPNKIGINNSYNGEQENSAYNRKIEILFSLQEILLEKVETITQRLKNESHLQVIETYTNILLNCLKILNKIPLNRQK